ncbi:hypothetical protein CHGG_04772 [Chaetomium globosum CBS 148.51]|uniref:Uncharacterized protein n=1 Tax=Chaetomium globosum (strain ATCC 6205 / CBS 148.51 / DSM 1962 / NBRC 6347 / NRRL 1970) TaxID=306901 RepID=Q2H0C4_CHAGB|nr:uncharacterized protein CHGG_04772 [Chaetomium globosum CBS 148.51]EAQ88153.1 hypothetical protein CHGG_04772 [Chaetomium globosum CBS 148.51]
MASGFHAGLEPARQDYPEVTHVSHGYGHHYQQPQPYYSQPYDPPTVPAPKIEHPAVPAPPSSYGGQTVASPFSAAAQPAAAQPEPPSRTGRTIFGCSLLVFILSCIIAILSAAVIGLAAATGIEAQRAEAAASSSLDALSALSSVSSIRHSQRDRARSHRRRRSWTTAAQATSTASKRRYTPSFSDAPNPPLLSLFTANFGTCMDACAAYTKYVPATYSSDGGNTSADVDAICQAVSFIPAWTNKLTAERGGAPGNCYLKGGPQNETGLNVPEIGVDCHAAIFTPGV